MLGLPELTKDISESGNEISPYDLPFTALDPLENGDLPPQRFPTGHHLRKSLLKSVSTLKSHSMTYLMNSNSSCVLRGCSTGGFSTADRDRLSLLISHFHKVQKGNAYFR